MSQNGFQINGEWDLSQWTGMGGLCLCWRGQGSDDQSATPACRPMVLDWFSRFFYTAFSVAFFIQEAEGTNNYFFGGGGRGKGSRAPACSTVDATHLRLME